MGAEYRSISWSLTVQRCFLALAMVVPLLAWTLGGSQNAGAVSVDVVISQVYGGGGNAAAPYTNDFIELFNRGASPVDVTGWSVQYASATGNTWSKTNLVGTIPAGRYYLVQESAGTGCGGPCGSPLPLSDATGTVMMNSTVGKVALVTNQGTLTCGASPGDCFPNTSIRDFVGYGTGTNNAEISPAPTLSNSLAALRGGAGCSDTDNNSADFAPATPNPRNISTPPNFCGGPGPARIHDIQGTGHRSPFEATSVFSVPGIVTARTSNGFYLQDPSPDANDATSEGIFVFTSSAPTVSVGDSILVSGTVSEFRPGGASTTNLTTTEITSPLVSVLSSGNPLPAPVVIGTGGRIPPAQVIEDDASGDVETSGVFDPSTDGIDFYESLEGMRVQVNNPVVVGPRNDFGEIPVLGDDGANASLRTPRGGIVIRPGDFNPERIFLDDSIVVTPTANVGDHFSGPAIGVMDYSFGNFKLQITSSLTVVPGGLAPETTSAAGPQQLAIATFNVENLDPGDGAAKFNALATLIVNNLQAPDLIAVEEIQDNNGPTNDTVVDATTTFNTLISAIQAAGGPTYQFRQINPVDDQDGGEPGGNIRVGFLFRTDRGLGFVDRAGGTPTGATTVVSGPGGPQLSFSPGRIDPTNPAFNSSRKPLAAELTFNGQTFFAIANHFNSKGGDQPLFGHFQPPVLSSEAQRVQQAQIVNNFVDDILALNANANVVVLGDLNDFQFSPALTTLKGGVLTTLIDTLPENERYTYAFEGNAQALDHMLVSSHLLGSLAAYDVVHVNAEFTIQQSDHDPQVARFNLGAPTTTPIPTPTRTPTPSLTQTPSPTLSPAATVTRTATQTVVPGPNTLSGTVSDQRVPAPPDAVHQLDLRIEFFDPVPAPNAATTLRFVLTATTDNQGAFSRSGIPNGTYDVRVKYPQGLSNESKLLTFGGGNTVTRPFGLLLAGDADANDQVTAADFTDLKQTFTQPTNCAIQHPIPIHCADFDANRSVSPNDFSLLKQNFGRSGPTVLP
jgi:uncharacterized protein